MVAKQVIRTLVNVKTEKIDVLLPTEKEVWTLPVSIFKPRSLRGPDQADSRDFTDTPEVIDKMFETDWQRLVSKVRTVLYVPWMQELLITGHRRVCSKPAVASKLCVAGTQPLACQRYFTLS